MVVVLVKLEGGEGGDEGLVPVGTWRFGNVGISGSGSAHPWEWISEGCCPMRLFLPWCVTDPCSNISPTLAAGGSFLGKNMTG